MSASDHDGRSLPRVLPPSRATAAAPNATQPASQAPPAVARLHIWPVPVPPSMTTARELPPDGVVRTAILRLPNPTRDPTLRVGPNEPPPLADAFFPSDEEDEEAQVGSGGAGIGRNRKGLTCLQWLAANLLILLVVALLVLATFGPRVFAASGRHAAAWTTPRIVLVPDSGFRKPPHLALPRAKPFDVPEPPPHELGRAGGERGASPHDYPDDAPRGRVLHRRRRTTRRHRKVVRPSSPLSFTTVA